MRCGWAGGSRSTVDAADEPAARETVDQLARDLLSNPFIESYDIEAIGGASSTASAAVEEG